MGCVGWKNHKYFILFLYYTWVGCLYTSLFTFPIFKIALSPQNSIWKFNSSPITIIYSWLVAVCVIFGVGALGGW